MEILFHAPWWVWLLVSIIPYTFCLLIPDPAQFGGDGVPLTLRDSAEYIAFGACRLVRGGFRVGSTGWGKRLS